MGHGLKVSQVIFRRHVAQIYTYEFKYQYSYPFKMRLSTCRQASNGIFSERLSRYLDKHTEWLLSANGNDTSAINSHIDRNDSLKCVKFFEQWSDFDIQLAKSWLARKNAHEQINKLHETLKEEPSLCEIARDEIQKCLEVIEDRERDILVRLVDKIKQDRNPMSDADVKNEAILEVRAGTGGLEAALFAADLLQMYRKYAERMGWKLIEQEVCFVNESHDHHKN
jgi:protein subunit release factor A